MHNHRPRKTSRRVGKRGHPYLIWIPDDLKDFWESLPPRSRSPLVQKLLRLYKGDPSRFDNMIRKEEK